MTRKCCYDLDLSLPDAGESLIRELELLEPCGQDNPAPVFRILGAKVEAYSYVGKASRDHLRLTLMEDGFRVNAICFGHVQKYCFLSEDNEYLGTLSINDYDRKPQLMIQGMQPRMTRPTLKAYALSLNGDFAEALLWEAAAPRTGVQNVATWEQALAEDLQKSLYGTLVCFNSRAGLERALKIKAVADALKQGRLSIPCETAVFSDSANTLTFVRDPAVLGKYERVYAVGAFALGEGPNVLRYSDDAVERAFQDQARLAFMDRTALLGHYGVLRERLKAMKTPALESTAALARMLDISTEQACFLTAVFSELGLIDRSDHGKIQFKPASKQKKDLNDSAVYRTLHNMLQ